MTSTPESVTPNLPPSATGFSPELQAEIDAAMAQIDRDADAEDARKAAAPKHDPRPQVAASVRPAGTRGPRVVTAGREHRTGTIVSVGPTDIFLEFGPKELGVLPRIQFKEDELPKTGDSLEVVIDKFETSESLFLCSRPGAIQKAAWEGLEPGQVVEARVKAVSKGGLECELADHAAFMPASQVAIERVADLSVYVGEKLKCKVVRVERIGRGNIILSRRDVLDEERRESAKKLKDTLAIDQTIEGVVRKVMPFGAFVDLGGVDGLIHISDLTYDRINFGEKAVEKYVKEGQRVSVRILKIDWENDRISLGFKQVQGDPFASATEKIAESAELNGKVTKITEFGAFVEIGPGVEGLVHISELDHKRVVKVEDVVKVDEVVRVKVLKIDPDNRRISLSIKALKPLPELSIGGAGGTGPGKGGKGKKGEVGRSAEEILKETPALRRMREKNRKMQFKGGLM